MSAAELGGSSTSLMKPWKVSERQSLGWNGAFNAQLCLSWCSFWLNDYFRKSTALEQDAVGQEMTCLLLIALITPAFSLKRLSNGKLLQPGYNLVLWWSSSCICWTRFCCFSASTGLRWTVHEQKHFLSDVTSLSHSSCWLWFQAANLKSVMDFDIPPGSQIPNLHENHQRGHEILLSTENTQIWKLKWRLPGPSETLEPDSSPGSHG